MFLEIAQKTRNIRKSITLVAFLSLFVPQKVLFIEKTIFCLIKNANEHKQESHFDNGNFFIEKHLFQCKHASKTIEN